LTVRIDEEETKLLVRTEEGGLFPGQPIGDPVDPLQLLDSTQALSVMIESGGEKYLGDHELPLWPFGLHLEYTDVFRSEGPITWRGTF